LHPYITHNIPLSTPGLRIADFGTGTGIFPLSLAPLLHPSSTIIGFDISAAQFPLLESLPQNIQLQEHDILVRLPEKYEGCFDIIAVRALVTALADKEWDVAVGNLVRYLSAFLVFISNIIYISRNL
jgi:ubiquinone/menaquinone biosynthesis C-methylase UbiE